MVELTPVNRNAIKGFLQDTEIEIHVAESFSRVQINANLLTIPQVIPDNMVVAVTPTCNLSDKYWIVQVLSKKTSNLLTYNLRYYKYSKQKSGWQLMREQNAYRTAAYSAVLYAGVEFNANSSMKKACVKHIQHVLAQQ